MKKYILFFFQMETFNHFNTAYLKSRKQLLGAGPVSDNAKHLTWY